MLFFKVKNIQQQMIHLVSGISFVYNGQLVTCHQSCVHNHDITRENVVNVSSYGNQKLFNHL